MNKYIKPLILLLIVFASTLLFHAFLESKNTQSNTLQGIEQLTAKEYKRSAIKLGSIVKKENPRVAINELEAMMKKDSKVLGSCHELLHEIGFQSFKKYNDFANALSYKDDICVSGYTHGVIEGYFSNVTDVDSAINNICNNYKPNKFLAWECYHGVGHGLMFFNKNDVKLALDTCRNYDTDFKKSACANGVFMENFNADNLNHPSKYLDPKKPYYPCNSIKDFKSDCYMNAPIYFLQLLNSDYDLAAKWCDSVEREHISTCYFGLASQMTRRNMDQPKLVEQYCDKLPYLKKRSCLRGIVSWYVSYNGTLKDAIQVCGKLNKKNQRACMLAVEAYQNQF